MNITRAQIDPFLDTAIPDAKDEVVDAWLTAISAELGVTFGTDLPAAIAPAVYNIVADAITRRLDRGSVDPRILQQTAGPSMVKYNVNVTNLFGWFMPGEIERLVALFLGGGTVRSVRTSAPDAVRFGNIAARNLYDQPDVIPLVGEVVNGPEWFEDEDGDAS